MKTCKDCNIVKDKTEFYGIQGDCKECFKKRVKKNRNETNREYYLSYDKARATSERRRQWRRKRLIEDRAANPLANKARQAVARALRSGKLIKEPCHCGEAKVEGHHPDYNQPLFVIWLCHRHHKLIHGRTIA